MVKFKRCSSTYEDIAWFIHDTLTALDIYDFECILTMRYDDNEETENVLFIDNGDCFGVDIHPTTDFLENQKIIYVIGIRTIQNPETFIEVGDNCAEE